MTQEEFDTMKNQYNTECRSEIETEEDKYLNARKAILAEMEKLQDVYEKGRAELRARHSSVLDRIHAMVRAGVSTSAQEMDDLRHERETHEENLRTTRLAYERTRDKMKDSIVEMHRQFIAFCRENHRRLAARKEELAAQVEKPENTNN